MAKLITGIPLLTRNNVRLFHSSPPYSGQSKVMKKIMGNRQKKKPFYHDSPPLPTPKSFDKDIFDKKQPPNSRRTAALNKLFMRYITDLMSTGECSSKFVGHGIEINRVQVTPDFKCVNVFWMATGTETDNIAEAILHSNSGSLRHELTQLKVIGVVPKINFVKDKHYARAIEVDRLLAKADFGDDYVPVDLAKMLKTQLELTTTLEPHIIHQIHSIEQKEATNLESEEPLPLMPQNVFGLNHVKMMEYIMKSKKKSQAVHRLDMDDEADVPQSDNPNPVQFASVHEEREAFREFLHKREVIKSKAAKEYKNYNPELDYLKEEWLERQKNSDYEVDDVLEENDYIDEETNNLK